MTRHFQILVSENMPSNLPANTLIINEFSKIQNLLGQEFETILFDARKGIHLEHSLLQRYIENEWCLNYLAIKLGGASFSNR